MATECQINSRASSGKIARIRKRSNSNTLRCAPLFRDHCDHGAKEQSTVPEQDGLGMHCFVSSEAPWQGAPPAACVAIVRERST